MSGEQVNQRLADYFVVTGLDELSGLEPDHLSGKLGKIVLAEPED